MARKTRTITVGSGVTIPPVTRDSIYPWDDLLNPDVENPHFFVACDDEEEAERLRPSVYQSGKSYYDKRETSVAVVTRVMEDLKGSDNWGVFTWAVEIETD